MAFKPKKSGNSGSNSNNDVQETRNFPVPKSGPRKARISLIVDLGTQNRPDVYELDGKLVTEDTEGAIAKPQKPAQQVVVFADLVNDIVDYGGEIGEAQYRLMLNKSFQGNIQGINFSVVPPKDAKGKLIAGKKWGLHPQNLLSKLCTAVGRPDVAIDDGKYGLDLEQLLGLPFMAQVDVKVTADKNGKTDADGNVIEYKNVSFKGASPVPMQEDDDGNETPMPVAKLRQEPRCITFESATVEDIKFLRGNIIKMIKLSKDYAGSQMQAAIEEYESSRGDSSEEDEEEAPAKPVAKPKAAAKKPVKVPVDDEDDSDVPF